MKKLLTLLSLTFVIAIGSITTTAASCNNNEPENNGDCVTNDFGDEFCESSWIWHDCVQVQGGGADELPDQN